LNYFAELVIKTGLSQQSISELVGYSPRTVHRWFRGEIKPRESAVKILESRVAREKNILEQTSFTFIDLFAGIGGLRKGFEVLGGKCVFTSEWDEYAQKTYKANFECDHPVNGDITKIDAKEIPEHDILLAGFPCQPFSIAGVSKKNSLHRPHGFNCETQGTLFFDVARILAYHRPRAFLLENVKNLVNHDKGRTFKIIRDTLSNDLGYHVQFRVIDAKPWVPQHRERIFIAGFRDTTDFSFNSLSIPDATEGPKLDAILHPEDGTEDYSANSQFIDKSGRVLPKYTLSDHLWQYLQDYARKHREKGNGFGYSLVGRDDISRTLSARYHKDGSEILIMQSGKNPRRLTPRECSRLMGFDKPGESKFLIPVSDTRAYRQFGNAVVVPVVETVARHMLPWILNSEGHPVMLRQLSLEGFPVG